MRRGALPTITVALHALVVGIGLVDGGATAVARPAFAAIACLLLAAAALASSGPVIPAGRGTRIALASLAGLAVWTTLSLAWTSSSTSGTEAVQLVVGYLALLWAALLVLGDVRPRVHRLVEPGLALGTTMLVGYGVIARALPGVISIDGPARAGGRLSEPLGYWNAAGLIAAIGLVLCVRLASDASRPAATKAAALAASPLLSVGVTLSYSRAALAAAIVGVLLLAALSETRSTLLTITVATAAGALGPLATLPFPGVRGSAEAPGGEGAAFAVCMLITMGIAAALGSRVGRGREGGPPAMRGLRTAALAAMVIVGLAPFIAGLFGQEDGGARTFGASAARLTEAGSNRSAYWSVAGTMARERPLGGDGAGSFEAGWLKERTIDEKVQNAHSLPLEIGAELGLVGVLLLGGFMTGLIVAALATTSAARIAGPLAGLATWSVGVSVDWHWQIPAVTGTAMMLAACVLAAERRPGVEP